MTTATEDAARACTAPADYTAYVAARRHSLLAAAYDLTRHHQDAEDLLQTVLARTYPAWPRIRDVRAFDAYVRRALVNQRIDWSRRGWRRGCRRRWRNRSRPSTRLPATTARRRLRSSAG